MAERRKGELEVSNKVSRDPELRHARRVGTRPLLASLAAWTAVTLLSLFVSACHQSHPGEQEYEAVVKALLNDGTRLSRGNSPDAERLAQVFHARLTQRNTEPASGSRGTDTSIDAAPRVWCELNGNRACFVVHIPYLKMYGTELTNELLDLTWQAALAAQRTDDGARVAELAIILRGNEVYGGFAFGLGSGPPHKERGNVAPDHRLYRFFLAKEIPVAAR